jgi:hypothetical protein
MSENRPRYLWIRPNSVESPMVLIDDPVAIFRGNQFDESVDKLYQIGNEVKMKVVVEPVPSYRLGENSFQPKIVFKTRYGMVANPFAQD